MVYIIIGGLCLCISIITLGTYKEYSKAAIAGVFAVASMMFFLNGAETKTKEAVIDRLLKEKKIEWRVSNDGQPYLILKDSSLSVTWKYLE